MEVFCDLDRSESSGQCDFMVCSGLYVIEYRMNVSITEVLLPSCFPAVRLDISKTSAVVILGLASKRKTLVTILSCPLLPLFSHYGYI